MPTFTALPTDIVRAYQAAGLDAFGNAPERAVSDGGANPCRHCLRQIPEGAGMLILAHKPFQGTHPYAEVGPIFLCAEACERGGTHGDAHSDADGDADNVPQILTTSPDYLLKGYTDQDRIQYGTGTVTPTDDLGKTIAEIFAHPNVAYIHVRSARNNCYQCRIDRDD